MFRVYLNSGEYWREDYTRCFRKKPFKLLGNDVIEIIEEDEGIQTYTYNTR